MAKEPDVLILGDSIVDTTDTMLNIGGFTKSWCGLLSKDTLISIYALSGATSTNLKDGIDYIKMFKPKKVIFEVGVNDGNATSWISNMENYFLPMCEEMGAEPIFVLWGIREVYATALSTMRDWVKASGYRYIDWLSATTVDGQGTTRKDGIFISDGLHPNAIGHRLIYEATKSAIPDLVAYW